MVSGRFLLDPGRDAGCGRIFKKYIPRVAAAFIFWSAVYTAAAALAGGAEAMSLRELVLRFLKGEYHMWFLYAIAGLYLITPILRRLVTDRKLTGYFLILWLVFQVLLQNLRNVSVFSHFLSSPLSAASIYLPLGYSGYFVLGYYLHSARLGKKQVRLFAAMAGLGILCTCALSTAVSLIRGEGSLFFSGYFMPNVVMTASGLFVLCGQLNEKAGFMEKPHRLLSALSECSFGMYLIHPLLLRFFSMAGFTPTAFFPALSVPALLICVFLCSFALIWVLRRIPLLRGIIM